MTAVAADVARAIASRRIAGEPWPSVAADFDLTEAQAMAVAVAADVARAAAGRPHAPTLNHERPACGLGAL